MSLPSEVLEVMEGKRWLDLAFAQAPRFWRKVRKTDGCWYWLGGKDKDGYGKFQVTLPRVNGREKQKHVRAHRLAWVLERGFDIPSGLVAIHSCDTPACVRPDHLRVGTQAENRLDCMRKGRGAVGDRNGRKLHPKSYPLGGRHPMSRIDEVIAIQIKTRHAAGERVCDICRALNVTRSTVDGIIRGRTWREARPRGKPLGPNRTAAIVERQKNGCAICNGPKESSIRFTCRSSECVKEWTSLCVQDLRSAIRDASVAVDEANKALDTAGQQSLFGGGA